MFVDDANAQKNAVKQAIQRVAGSTGMDFRYLMKTAEKESSFNPNAKASGSSASGPFQFIESTWLQMVKEEGAAAGMADYARAIEKTPYGYEVKNPALKQEILALRHDPETSAHMAAKFSQKNAAYLEAQLGRTPSNAELYMAHFLGAGGAAKLIQADPSAVASTVFSKEAKTNPAIFNTSDGRAKTIAEVYASLAKGYDTVGGAMGQAYAALETPATTHKALKRADAPMFHTMTVAGKPSVKMVTVYLPSFTERAEEVNAQSQAAQAQNAVRHYKKPSYANGNFFSSLVHPNGAAQPLSQVI